MIALLLLAAQAAPAEVKSAPVAVAAPAVDPARLKAAQALVEQIMPSSQRETMMKAMLAPMLGNIRQVMSQNPAFAQMMGKDPRVAAAVQRFVEKMMADTMADVARDMPKLMDAMAIAYGRQFTVVQLDEARGFYASPTGHEFISKMPQIMADPAVMEAQRALMSAQLAAMPTRMKELAAEIDKLVAEKAPAK